MKSKKYHKIDKECRELCDAMNMMPGIQTIESCCGHGKEPYRIWFRTKKLSALPRLLYYFNGCHCGYYNWRVYVKTDCSMNPVVFCVEGNLIDRDSRIHSVYAESKHIAQLLREESKERQKELL